MASEDKSLELLGQVKENIAESLDRIEEHIKIRVDSITDEGTAALKANKRGAWITAAVVVLVGLVLSIVVPRATSSQILASLAILETKKIEMAAEIQQHQIELAKLKEEKDEFNKMRTDEDNKWSEKFLDDVKQRLDILEREIISTLDIYDETDKKISACGIVSHHYDNGEFDVILPREYKFKGNPSIQDGTITSQSGETFAYKNLWVIRVKEKPNMGNPSPR